MKAITILQPYASLKAAGLKIYETRSWETSYRGKIAIHAGKNDFVINPANAADKTLQEKSLAALGVENWGRLPHSAIIAVADLVECYQVVGAAHPKPWLESKPILDKNGEFKRGEDGRRIGWKEKPYPEGDELMYGNFEIGQWAWEFENVTPLPAPIPYRGNQRLWELPDSVIEAALRGKESESQ